MSDQQKIRVRQMQERGESAVPPKTQRAKLRLVDAVERIFWTVVASGLGALAASPLVDLDALQGAAVAALAGGINAVLVIARWRLAVLPDPGQGLPNLPTGVDR